VVFDGVLEDEPPPHPTKKALSAIKVNRVNVFWMMSC